MSLRINVNSQLGEVAHIVRLVLGPEKGKGYHTVR